MPRNDTEKDLLKKHLGVAVLGFGTVGKAVVRILCDDAHSRLRLTHVCNRNVASKKVSWVPADVIWTDDIDVVLSSDTDIVVEVIGGQEPATHWIRRALQAGKSVVTANKEVVARYGVQLEMLARECGRRLYFEAAVAGGVPVIHGLREGLAGDRLFRILGILNGTCNYILTRMEAAQVSFNEALQEAQELGYAEADPAADVDGADARAKLAILSTVALDRTVDVLRIPIQTISTIEAVDFIYANRLKYTIRQVSRAERNEADRIFASVQPMLVPQGSPLAQVIGSRNVVVVEGEYGGETAFSGHGAGGDPTAVAVVSDLESIVREETGRVVETPLITRTSVVVEDFSSPHYVRFVVADRPGIIAALAGVFSRHGANIDSVLQEPGWSRDELPFVITLDSCSSDAVNKALAATSVLDFNVRPPLWMPVLT